MRIFILVMLLLLTATASSTPVSDSIKDNYEKYANKDYPAMGLLDVRVDDVIPALGNDMMIIATIDNATRSNVYSAVMTGGMAYVAEYYQHKNLLPDKAKIYVDKAGGTQIGAGVVYAKWVNDLFENGFPPSDSSNHVFIMKMWNATSVWTWELNQ